MRVLVYKRTHHGDPNTNSCFGVRDCMGSVRSWHFDAVIGVGGIGPEARTNGISGTASWIGIGPHKVGVDGKRGPSCTLATILVAQEHTEKDQQLQIRRVAIFGVPLSVNYPEYKAPRVECRPYMKSLYVC